jgi:RHS repeat-associated protein
LRVGARNDAAFVRDLTEVNDLIRGVKVSYKSDAEGRRVGKTVAVGATKTEVDYILDRARAFEEVMVIGKRVNSGTREVTRLTMTPDGVGDLIAQKVGETPTAYVLQDGQGSNRITIDENGNVQEVLSYDAFGNRSGGFGRTGSEPTALLHLYVGEQYDPDANLYHLRARDYDPSVGRMTSMDLLEGITVKPLTLNKYIYSQNDPINAYDPSGYMTLGGMMSGLNTVSTMYTIGNVMFQFATGNMAGGALMIAEEVVYSKLGGAFGKHVPKLIEKQVGLFNHVLGRGVKLRLGEAANSKALIHNLKQVGITQPSGTQAHHIVGGAYQKGKETRQKLKDAGIDVNSPMNGVFLPGCGKSKAIGTVHCGNHTKEYEEYVWEQLRGKTDKVDIINTLSDIRNDLLMGNIRLNLR